MTSLNLEGRKGAEKNKAEEHGKDGGRERGVMREGERFLFSALKCIYFKGLKWINLILTTADPGIQKSRREAEKGDIREGNYHIWEQRGVLL